jgi:hypothetical protein
MIPLCRWALVAVGALAPAAALANPVFNDAPIPCGGMTQFKGCSAAFDGQTLRITYTPNEGKPSHAIYKYCVSTSQMIHCPAGYWESARGSVPLGARSLGLRDNKPYPE